MNSAAPSGETPGPGQEEPAGEATVPRMLLGAQLRRLREAADQLSGEALPPTETTRFTDQAAGET